MEDVEKLLATGFIREIYNPEWLANVVMVKNSNGKWRMCVDFTNLNHACPKCVVLFSQKPSHDYKPIEFNYNMIEFLTSFMEALLSKLVNVVKKAGSWGGHIPVTIDYVWGIFNS